MLIANMYMITLPNNSTINKTIFIFFTQITNKKCLWDHSLSLKLQFSDKSAQWFICLFRGFTRISSSNAQICTEYLYSCIFGVKNQYECNQFTCWTRISSNSQNCISNLYVNNGTKCRSCSPKAILDAVRLEGEILAG